MDILTFFCIFAQKEDMKKKYFTEEERKAAKREYMKRHYQKHKEKKKQYHQKHKEERLEWQRQYYQKHKEERAEYYKQWYQDHKEEALEKKKQYRQTPMGRALYLLNAYRREDKKHDRGECTLTPEWIINNIFAKKCHWCPETDWTKIGCDRIDNELPHTPDNVIPCCERCNKNRGTKSYDEYKKSLEQKAL